MLAFTQKTKTMKVAHTLLLLILFCYRPVAQTTVAKMDRAQFFTELEPLELTIFFDLKKLNSSKMKEGVRFPALCVIRGEDSTEIREPIKLEIRGKFRKAHCYLPPLKIYFKSEEAPILSPLGSLKLVNVCDVGQWQHTEYLLKEYLTYRMYNIITDKSLKVRLLRIRFADSVNKKRSMEHYAFLIEDVKDMALRNGCLERKRNIAHSNLTDRKQMTKVALFEYMISNADWSVAARHNIKLIAPKEDTNDIPYPVPYDFDHSGLVDAEYALPPPHFNIAAVTQRIYMGFPRSMEELQEAGNEFLQKKDSIYALIRGFEPLNNRTRKEMISFLEDFFQVLARPSEIKAAFINNARKN